MALKRVDDAVARAMAYLECVALVREAVAAQRAPRCPVERLGDFAWRRAHPEYDRAPELDLEAWYARAGAAVDVLDGADAA